MKKKPNKTVFISYREIWECDSREIQTLAQEEWNTCGFPAGSEKLQEPICLEKEKYSVSLFSKKYKVSTNAMKA